MDVKVLNTSNFSYADCSMDVQVLKTSNFLYADRCMDVQVLRTSAFSYVSHINTKCLKKNRMCGIVLTLSTTKCIDFNMKIFQSNI